MPILIQEASGPALLYPNTYPFEVDLVVYLNSQGITVYPDHIPQGAAPPASTFSLISGVPKYNLRSTSGLESRRYQFSHFSTAKTDVISLESSVRNVLSGFTGTVGVHYISSCRLISCLDLPYQANVDSSDNGIYQRVSEYRIFFK